MMKITKKVGSIAVGVVFAATAITSTAFAQSIEELQALIANLTAQISALSSTQTVADVVEKTGMYVHHPSIDYRFSTNLRRGSRGEAVRMLQKIINVGADGVFGPGTEKAVKAWQTANGLGADGKVGPMTRSELNKKSVVTVVANTNTTSTPTVVTNSSKNTNTTSTSEVKMEGDKLFVVSTIPNEMIVGTGQRVIFSKLTLTAGSQDVQVKDILVEQTGSAARNALSTGGVLLLDMNKLKLDSDTIDNDDEAKLDVDMTIRAKTSVVLYIAGKLNSTKATLAGSNGLNVAIDVTEITVKGNTNVINGEVESASHEINANLTKASGVTVKVTRDENNASMGERVDLTEVVIENGNTIDDDTFLRSIKIEQKGTIDEDGLENIKIQVGGKTYRAVQDTNDEEFYTFNFGTNGILIEENDSIDLTISAKITDDAKATKTVRFDLSDVLVEYDDGEEVTAVITNGTEDTDIDSAEVIFSSSSEIDSDDVASGTTGVKFDAFQVRVSGSGIEGNLKVKFDLSTIPANTDENDLELENVAIYTEEGVLMSDREDSSSVKTSGNSKYIEVEFNDFAFSDTDDDDTEYIIKGDISSDTPDGVRYDINKITYENVETGNGDDISVRALESTSFSATQTVEGAVITVEIDDADDKKVNAEQDDVEIAVLEIDADRSGKDIEFERVTVTLALTESTEGSETDDSLKIDNEVRSCAFYNGRTRVSSTEDADKNVRFDFDDLTVDAGEDLELSLKCNLSDDLAMGDTISTTIVKYKAESTDGDDLDSGTISSPSSTSIKITEGTVTLVKSSDDENDDKSVVDGADDVTLAIYEFESNNSDRIIEKVVFTFDSTVSDDNIDNYNLYVNGRRNNADADVNSGRTTVTFDDLNIRANEDDTVELELKGDVELASGGTSVIRFVTSIAVEDNVNSTPTTESEDGPKITIVKSVPVITQINVNTNSLTGSVNNKVIFAFKVEADGGDVYVQDVKLKIEDEGITVKNLEYKVYDNANMSGNTEKETTFATLPEANSDGDKIVKLAFNDTIREDDVYYFYLLADLRGVSEGDSVGATLAEGTNIATSGITFSDKDTFTGTAELGGFSYMNDDFDSLLSKDD